MLHFTKHGSTVCLFFSMNPLLPSLIELTDKQCVAFMALCDGTQGGVLESSDWEDEDIDGGENVFHMPSHEGGELDELVNMQHHIRERYALL